jgi:hypothetical protein
MPEGRAEPVRAGRTEGVISKKRRASQMSKKHLLISTSIAAALFATAAYADSSTVYLNQQGDAETAAIDQSGNGNYVGYAGQAFTQSGSSNKLNVSQSGAGNTIGVYAPGYQAGSSNSAHATQAGVNSHIEIQQNGAANGVLANFGWTNSTEFDRLSQDASASGSGIVLYQNGNSNVFDVGQGGTSNTVSLTQTGMQGQAFVRQNENSGYHDSTVTVNQDTSNSLNYANVNAQIGNYLTINIAQTGSLQGAGVDQFGTGSVFVSNQSGTGNLLGVDAGPYYGYGADNPVLQYGDYNQLYSYQSGSLNIANGSQIGNNLYLSNVQSGTGNSLLFTQQGSYNNAYNTQQGTNGAASIKQYGGSGNVVTSVQYAGANGASMTALQNGSNNTISSLQYDGANLALLTQVGVSNTITGAQNNTGGLANTANVSQNGNLNNANYVQNGTNNLATITQH